MKCFHFPSAASSQRELSGGREGTGSWARSFSVASSASEARRSAFESCAGEETWRMERKPEGLRAFDFAELKAATRGFSRAMIIGEGGFGCVYRGIISVSGEEDGVGGVKTMDVAVKQHNKCGSQVVGTIGYAAPEYVQMGRLTSKSDVWSYGVVLYEIITGRRSIDRNLPRNEQKLLDWVKPYATDPKKLHIIIDPRLEGRYSVNSVQKLIALANKCLMKRPKARPPMSKVVQMLDEIMEMTNEECTESSDERGCDNQGKIKLKDSIRNCIRAFDLNKEFSILRNRTLGKLDWKGLAPWPVMDLARAWG